MKQYYVIDLFAGAGGFSYGFSKAGFIPAIANEISPVISSTYQCNHPNTLILANDIKSLDKITLEKTIKDKIGKVDNNIILIGGPPCQSYSTSGKRKLDDRANLFLEYKRVLGIIKPILFIFENVTGLLSMDNKKLFPRVVEALEEEGYNISHKVLNASDYGVPQDRKRVFVIGVRKDLNLPEFKFREGDFVETPRTFSYALYDLPATACGEEQKYYMMRSNAYTQMMRGKEKFLTRQKAPNANERMKELMKTLKDGEDRSKLPARLQPKSGFGNSYSKICSWKPAPTITRNFSCVSSARCIHPKDNRVLTIREGARLQSFPDNYIFMGTDEEVHIQIGNAVPPLLAEELGKQIKAYLDTNL